MGEVGKRLVAGSSVTHPSGQRPLWFDILHAVGTISAYILTFIAIVGALAALSGIL